jgi:hypothetical protein
MECHQMTGNMGSNAFVSDVCAHPRAQIIGNCTTIPTSRSLTCAHFVIGRFAHPCFGLSVHSRTRSCYTPEDKWKKVGAFHPIAGSQTCSLHWQIEVMLRTGRLYNHVHPTEVLNRLQSRRTAYALG